MKLSKLVWNEYFSTEDIISKKAQKYLMGGYDTGGGGDSVCNYLTCHSSQIKVVCQCTMGVGVFVGCVSSIDSAKDWCEQSAADCRYC